MAARQTLTAGEREVTVPTRLFIGGEWVDSELGATLAIENPSTRKTIVNVHEGSEKDLDKAVKAARTAFPSWSTSDPAYRGQLLHKLADLVKRDEDELLAIEMLDTGKTQAHATIIDIPGVSSTLRYFAGLADKITGDTSTNVPGCFTFTRREPIGVCGQILPWNYPLLMFIWKIAPALACGCSLVIKPSEVTPLSALKMCELIQEAGFPPGSVNVVNGYGKTVGSAIAHHMDIDKIAFTGSTTTGRSVMIASAKSNLKKVSLELGGKSPNIIFPDADINKAVEWSLWAISVHWGQVCHAGTRLYVHEQVYDEFLDAFTKRMSQIKIGDNFGAGIHQGPQNNKIQFERVMEYIDVGKKEGATVHLGGKAFGDGYFIEPTIFTDVKPEMRIVQEEIFGPVVVISRFKTEDEAIALANDSSYGLAAAVHTKDYERAIRVTAALRAGTMNVNMSTFVHCSMPFGGFKQSGIGREMGLQAIEGYTEVKSVFMNMGISAPVPF